MSKTIWLGTRKGLFSMRRDPAGWGIERVHFLGDAVTMVLADRRDGRVYAALGLGHFGVKLRGSTDGGATFEPLTTPAFPPAPEGVEEKTPSGAPWPFRTEQIWSLEAGLPSEPGVLWCGTIPGGLFRSEDHGASWSFVQSLWDHPLRKKWMGGGADQPAIHSIVVDPRDGRHVTLGVSTGGVWTTKDGGASWDIQGRGLQADYMPPDQAGDLVAQDPHCIALCPAAPDVLWMQHHNGVFRSEDGGASWTRLTVTPSAFGFPVVVDPRDPNVAYVVPGIKDEQRVPVSGRLVVSRTRDGGRTWDVLGKGLPDQHAYDVVLRHALALDETGDVLAFGSTTGNFWISEDGGASFQNVSHHLPPIYCVRFGVD